MGNLYYHILEMQRKLNSKVITESNYPAGAENDPNAPWNRSEPKYSSPIVPKVAEYTTVGFFPGELAILQNPKGEKYAFYFNHLSSNDFAPYAEIEKTYVGKDEDGEPEFDYSDDWEVDQHVVDNYVNDNAQHLSKGEGIVGWEDGIDLVKIDDALKNEILRTYGGNASIKAALA